MIRMTTRTRSFAATFALAGLAGLAGTFGLARTAAAQVVVTVPAPPIIAPPPPVFVATTAPVYYEGHATYWYGNRWVWRDTHGWHGYEREPVFLHEHRAHYAPRPRYEYHRR